MDQLLIALIVVVGAIALVGGFALWKRGAAEGHDAVDPSRGDAGPLGLRDRLQKTRHALGGRLGRLARRDRIDDEFWTAVEDLLVAADVGIGTAARLVTSVKAAAPRNAAEATSLLEGRLVNLLAGRERRLVLDSTPAVILVVGVNGGGKTTTIAKLAARLQREGSSVLLGAADTFRAAADDQLRAWADRIGADIVGGQPGADPASIAYDAYTAAKARHAGVVIVDTAGRLQSKANLMDELSKVARVLEREAGSIDEVLLVIDGTTGQNATAQARHFSEAVGVTGIVMTKLDGTARGGVVIAIEQEMDIPVKLIGLGEDLEDLVPFVPDEFVAALLDHE